MILQHGADVGVVKGLTGEHFKLGFCRDATGAGHVWWLHSDFRGDGLHFFAQLCVIGNHLLAEHLHVVAGALLSCKSAQIDFRLATL